jgi:hypothetical protein
MAGYPLKLTSFMLNDPKEREITFVPSTIFKLKRKQIMEKSLLQTAKQTHRTQLIHYLQDNKY